ncbi:hypothetical protein Cme02nite_42310 [Catellatospora methionotrophica]|uniref:YdhG-like domain-containing protein n=1 Tax=Catellatospora methionotrophica TaxID=121620 RepID=A0A8J3LCI0_9ACTN|nr:DUF1801 domain-containing protein [Catellatospora methionotrophica]GIG15899.1 hypothetical protein Cme02nite_42310 [Catellatospora methionotrophica]
MAARFTTIDDYIDAFPTEVQDVLQQVRRTILAAAPAHAGQSISYGIPTITLDGRYLVYFAGWKHHVSVYPVPDGDADFEEVVAPYRAAKGTLRFPLREPIPYDVITRVTAALVAQRAGDPGGA